MQTTTNIELNTLATLNFYRLPACSYDVYVFCRFLKKDICKESLHKAIKEHGLTARSKKAIGRSLNRLENLGYIKRVNENYSLVNQEKPNEKHRKFTKRNYGTTKFQVSIDFLKSLKNKQLWESQWKDCRQILNGSFIVLLSPGKSPITHAELQNKTFLTKSIQNSIPLQKEKFELLFRNTKYKKWGAFGGSKNNYFQYRAILGNNYQCYKNEALIVKMSPKSLRRFDKVLKPGKLKSFSQDQKGRQNIKANVVDLTAEKNKRMRARYHFAYMSEKLLERIRDRSFNLIVSDWKWGVRRPKWLSFST